MEIWSGLDTLSFKVWKKLGKMPRPYPKMEIWSGLLGREKVGYTQLPSTFQTKMPNNRT